MANYHDQDEVIKEIFISGKHIFFGDDCNNKITKDSRFINVSSILLDKYKWNSWDIDSKFVDEKLEDPPVPENVQITSEYIESRWSNDGAVIRGGDEILEKRLGKRKFSTGSCYAFYGIECWR